MDDRPAQKEDWVLTHQALDTLLQQLDPDRERAAEKYEQIRQRLIKLFRWRGCLRFEEYTDSTIDRVARRVAGGLEVQSANVYALFHGVALNLLKEHWRKIERESEALSELSHSNDAGDDPMQMLVEAEEEK